jgi:hypothetical protein
MAGGILEDEDIKQMVDNLINLDSASINQEISGLLDFSKREVKKFIKDFIERVENQRKYDEKLAVQQKKMKSSAAAKKAGDQQVVTRDFSKIPANRKLCYC